MIKSTLLTTLALFSLNIFSQDMSYEERNELATEIFENLGEKELKKAFIEILGLDDFAIDSSWDKHPDPNDFMERIDVQRNLEETWRLKWYIKQSWWKKAKMSESVGYSVRSKISSFGIKNNWDKTLYKKKGKVLSPPKF